MNKNKQKKEDKVAVKDAKHSEKVQETTVIRISHKNYERLRQEAYYKHTTIRQIADDILEDELRDKAKTL